MTIASCWFQVWLSVLSCLLSYKSFISTWGIVTAGTRKLQTYVHPTWVWTVYLKAVKMNRPKQDPFQDIRWEDLEESEGRKAAGRKRRPSAQTFLKEHCILKLWLWLQILCVFKSNQFRRKISAVVHPYDVWDVITRASLCGLLWSPTE